MRVWIDITNSPHVLFFAPIIRLLEAQGHTVTLTARKYAQTEQLLSRYGLAAVITVCTMDGAHVHTRRIAR